MSDASWLQKRSLSLSGHRTSVALEPEFWDALQAIAAGGNCTLSALINSIDEKRDPGHPLASALRLHALRQSRRDPTG